MSFGSFQPQRQQAMLSDINVTPMVDVMLVLLVIFILAAPLFTQALRLDLPAASAPPGQAAADSVTIAIDAAGALYWLTQPVAPGQLATRLAQAAKLRPRPELQLRADKNTRYEVVAQVMAAAQAQGMQQMAFITEPNKENTHGKR